MSRPVKSIRCATTPKKMSAGSKSVKVGKPDEATGRERTGAGGYAPGGESKAMVIGPSQIFKDNRRS